MNALLWIGLVLAVAMMGGFVLALCAMAKRADRDMPLHPQRRDFVERAQREIREQARWARSR
jgi:hypothetical protein